MHKLESVLHDLKVCDKYLIHEDRALGEPERRDILPRVTLILVKEFKRASGPEG